MAVLGTNGQRARAFANRVGPEPGGPRQPGSRPVDLGLRQRAAGAAPALATCPDAPPGDGRRPANCFTSTRLPGDDEAQWLRPWRFQGYSDTTAAFQELIAVVQAYPPGQQGVDGGGFQIVEVEAASGYLRAEFESLNYGFVDDVEFAVRPLPGSDGTTGEVLMRSASRQGAVDMGVNALRLNWIASKLCALPGSRWKADAITAASHPDYVASNQGADPHPYLIEGKRGFGLPNAGIWALER